VPNPVVVWLKLNRMITKIGNDRYRMNAPVYVGRMKRVQRFRGRRIGAAAALTS
jgi:hypothetical protein